MEICKYGRVEIDYYKINYEFDSKYPKIIPAEKGTSICYYVSPDLIFKRKQQDGNYGISNASNSMHHFIYQEEVGSFDDLAEVFCYKLAKRLGLTHKVDIYGRKYEAPVVDVAEYKLASFFNKTGEEERGCISKNIIPKRGSLITGASLFKKYFGENKGKNSIENYLEVLQKYSSQTGTILDPNIVRDLIVNSFFCWKTANSDNHSNNITFIQSLNADGNPYLYVSKMIDNGSAWGCSSPYVVELLNGTKTNKYKGIFSRFAGKEDVSEIEAKAISFTSEPFDNHVAFKIHANTITKNIVGSQQSEYSSYLQGLSAYAFSNPEIYSSIYQIEKNFDVASVKQELEQEKVKFPPFFLQMVTATTQYKSQVLAQTMGDVFCKTAYLSCVSSTINEQDDVFKSFQDSFSHLPLQENIEGYIQNFLAIANKNNVLVNEENLRALTFLQNNNAQNQEGCNSQQDEPFEQ